MGVGGWGQGKEDLFTRQTAHQEDKANICGVQETSLLASSFFSSLAFHPNILL